MPRGDQAHVLQLLKPVHLRAGAPLQGSYCDEKPTCGSEETPLLTETRETPCAAAKTRCGQKKVKIKIKKGNNQTGAEDSKHTLPAPSYSWPSPRL